MKNFFFMTLFASFLIIGCGKQAPSPGVTDNEILVGNIQDLSGQLKSWVRLFRLDPKCILII